MRREKRATLRKRHTEKETYTVCSSLPTAPPCPHTKALVAHRGVRAVLSSVVGFKLLVFALAQAILAATTHRKSHLAGVTGAGLWNVTLMHSIPTHNSAQLVLYTKHTHTHSNKCKFIQRYTHTSTEGWPFTHKSSHTCTNTHTNKLTHTHTHTYIDTSPFLLSVLVLSASSPSCLCGLHMNLLSKV